MCTLRINVIFTYFTDVTVEPIETTWRLANAVCETSKHILMPGRSYKKADLIKTLDVGQKIWMKGWRMVTEREPGTGKCQMSECYRLFAVW